MKTNKELDKQMKELIQEAEVIKTYKRQWAVLQISDRKYIIIFIRYLSNGDSNLHHYSKQQLGGEQDFFPSPQKAECVTKKLDYGQAMECCAYLSQGLQIPEQYLIN